MTTIVASNSTHEAVGVDMKLGGASFGSGPKSACGGQASGLDQKVGAFDLDQGQASGEDRKVGCTSFQKTDKQKKMCVRGSFGF